MFDGQKELAQTTANEMVEQMPAELLAEIPDFLEAFVPIPLHVMVRFGEWENILRQERPADDMYVTKTVWHYSRALAFAATGRVENAETEKKHFDQALAAIPETRYLFNNSAKQILGVAEAMIRGEIAYRKGDFDLAFQDLREAVKRDDALNYDEPWGWMQPARHALGALLLEQGKVAEAERVYLADLKRHPKNAWALTGLAESLERLGKKSEATTVRKQLDTACERSDVTIKASCYCRLNTDNETAQ